MKTIILKTTFICGILDIAYAIILAILNSGSALSVLLSVASGPFGSGIKTLGWLGGLIGLGVHFAIMLMMVACFVYLVKSVPKLQSLNTVMLGAIYGALLYIIMYWVVLSLRWPTIFPQTDPMQIIKALAPHIFLVGIPMALITRKSANF